MTNIYFEFLDRLNSAGVEYAVLHGWESFRLGEVSDMDIAVTANHLPRIEACIRECYRVLNVFHYEASSFGFVLAPQNELASIFVADISSDYRWNGRIFFSDRELLQNRRLWNGYWVAGAAQEFAYLFVKKIYEKGSFPEHQRARIRDLVRALEGKAHDVLSKLLGSKWVDWVLARIGADEWGLLEQHVPSLRRSLRFQVLKRDYLNSTRYWKQEIKRFWERFRYPTGAVLALVGSEELCKRILIPRLAATFRGVFRQVLTSESNSRFKAKQAFRDRALLCRSALIFRHYGPDDPLPRALLAPSPDMVFILDGECCPSASYVFKSATTRSATAVVDTHADPDHIARTACDIFSSFLTQRYLHRRQIWFSEPLSKDTSLAQRLPAPR